MGKKSPATPAAPDPATTAAAQSQTNKDTAYWNAVLNNVNQVTPYGTLTYAQTGGGKQYNMDAYNAALQSYNNSMASGGGTSMPSAKDLQFIDHDPRVGKALMRDSSGNSFYMDASGSISSVPSAGGGFGSLGGSMPKLEDFYIGESPPQFTSTIKLSPEQQAILDSQQRRDLALGQLGEEQLGRIRSSVSNPYSYDGIGMKLPGEADMAALQQSGQDAIMARLNSQFAQDEEALRTRLINQGIGQGSEAYKREMESMNQRINDARQQAVMGGQGYATTALNNAMGLRNQQIQEYDRIRNAPLNEYNAMVSGVQVQNPQFSSQGYQGAAPVDYAGIVNQNYQNQVNQYNQKIAANNSATSGLFNLGGQVLGSFMGSGGAGSFNAAAAASGLPWSDRRLKTSIERVGEGNGFPIYEFEYIGDDRRYRGVMAQDVEVTMPEAVHEQNGWKAVDYGMLGLEMVAL